MIRMTDRDFLLLPSELFGFEGTLLDPNWPEVRGIFKGLWFWAHEPYWDWLAERAAPIAEGG